MDRPRQNELHRATGDRRRLLGAAGEEAAARFYIDQRFRVLARNWRAGRFAEIDLIVQAPSGLIVFAEVKTRRRSEVEAGFNRCGFDAVHRRKQQKIVTSAQMFLARYGLSGCPCRFDVLVVNFEQQSRTSLLTAPGKALVTHVPDAFT